VIAMPATNDNHPNALGDPSKAPRPSLAERAGERPGGLNLAPLPTSVVEKAAALMRERAEREAAALSGVQVGDVAAEPAPTVARQAVAPPASSPPPERNPAVDQHAAPAGSSERVYIAADPRTPMMNAAHEGGPRKRLARWALPVVGVAVAAFALGWNWKTTSEPAPVPAARVLPSSQPTVQSSAMPAAIAPTATDSAVAHPATLQREIEAVLRDWAQAWSNRNTKAYLAFYARDFTPPENLPRSAWETQRVARIAGKRTISVKVDGVEVSPLASGRVHARFAQSYEADGYIESARPKTMVFVREAGVWRIALETTTR
jgi:ketosteroid isomerase-like protein